ncbi:hypothetical protein [Sphingomonas arenae]|uniref:hypothetical protein n=1 Tax=Sphingomonas arenae TaxID=2812555 RepID=UPI0019689F9D|nr:hypothetical protein [Sphingomonas arenae]
MTATISQVTFEHAVTSSGGRLALLTARPEITAFAALVVWVAVFWNGPLINDVGWQLWIGRQINSGSRLYVDILELNPPLWFWFGALIERTTDATGVTGARSLTVALALLAGAGVLLCRRLLPDRAQRLALCGALVLTLFLTSPFALGQREQLTAVTILPYLALVSARAEGRRIKAPPAIAVALFAAVGLALKHYFALAPLALEVWLLWRTRRWSLRPEFVTLVLAGVGYLGSIALFTPAYLTTMVPLLRTAYGGYNQPLPIQLREPALFAALFTAGVLILRDQKRPPLAGAAIVATAAFTIGYFLQAKAFAYHAVPLLATTLVALLLGLFTAGNAKQPLIGKLLGLLASGCALAVPFAAGAARYDQAAGRATAALPHGSAITALTASGVTVWPLVQERGFRWHSPHMMLWMLAPAWSERQDGRIDPALEQLAATTRRQAALEIACKRPAMVLVDRRYDSIVPEGSVFRFFVGDPVFRTAIRNYEPAPDADYLQVFRRRGGDGAPPQMCSTRS